MDLLILNQSKLDRGIRLFVALFLLIIAYPFENLTPIEFAFIFIAGVLIFNTLSGNCYIYRAFGINTCPVKE
jgi:hypothetical protein